MTGQKRRPMSIWAVCKDCYDGAHPNNYLTTKEKAEVLLGYFLEEKNRKSEFETSELKTYIKNWNEENHVLA